MEAWLFLERLLCLGHAMKEEEFARVGGVFGSVEFPEQATDKLTLKVWQILNVKQELKNQLTI